MKEFIFLVASSLVALSHSIPSDQYHIGVGKADITGSAGDVNMVGYANPSQGTKGIHIRLFARAFIFVDPGNINSRFALVVADLGLMSQLIKLDVVRHLRATYGSLYTEKNLILSASHTHSSPGGYFQYFVLQVSSRGFIKENYDQIVRGIVRAVTKAHSAIKPATAYLKSGTVSDAQSNRSPSAYRLNPSAERAKYSSNVDSTMHLLRINDANGVPQGMVNWFPVHGTSMNSSNRLISGDNKGYAAQIFERTLSPGQLFAQSRFVGAFAQSHSGDVSPNTGGGRCVSSGFLCDIETSTCNGRSTDCQSVGPGRNMFESTLLIGDKQYQKAFELFRAASDNGLRGGIRVAHKYVDMSTVQVDLGNGRQVQTCPAALGYSFAAGATDGAGFFAFNQGMVTGNELWDSIRNIIKEPATSLVQCHQPKPIWLATGLMTDPYDWQPKIVDIQIAKIGQLVIVALPAEFTTMAGRRMIEAITKLFADAGQTVQVVLNTLSNVYTHYVTTPEEYNHQRYEGASTIFGPNTLAAYIQLFSEVARDIIANRQPSSPGPQPPYLKGQQMTFNPPVIYDGPGTGRFGDVLVSPKAHYRRGETVIVAFVGANPRNSLGTGLTKFMTVEMQNFLPLVNGRRRRDTGDGLLGYFAETLGTLTNFNADPPPPQQNGASSRGFAAGSTWRIVFTDAEWETRFHWDRESLLLGTSRVTLKWSISRRQSIGTYRMCYFGHSKGLFSGVTSFQRCSPNFSVIN